MAARESTEAHIDSGLTEERQSIDEIVKTQREKSDAQTNDVRHAPDYNLKSEQRDSDVRLKKERQRSDTALEAERETVDLATTRERDLKSAFESKLLSSERGTTDANLFAERTETDSATKGMVDSLKIEIDGHRRTQTSLTTRDEFIAIVSHDLKNPLGAASSCAAMLLEDFEHPPEIKRWIEFIQRNVNSSLRLISDLLDVERIIENKMEIVTGPNLIASVIRDATDTFTLAAQNKDLELEVDLCDDDVRATCDPERVKQVLFNLLSNAIKFTPPHGKITVRTKLTADTVTVEVSDTGCGMPQEKIATVFERFAQLASKDRSGLGLGLYIAKKIVEGHGRELKVESREGHGSTFTFELLRA